MSTEVQVVELPKELQEVQTLNLGLAKEKAEEHLAAFVPFVSTMTELKQKTESINFTDPTTEDAKLAREIRLAMAKNRVSSEKEKDARKKGLLTEGNLIQAAYNVVANASKMIEESLANVEKYEEIKRQKAIQAKQEERHAELVDYGFALPENLGEMSEEVYSSFKTGILAQHKAKIDAEEAQRKAEEDAKKKRELNDERMKVIRPLGQFLTDEEAELHLGEIEDGHFLSLCESLEARKNEYEAEQATIKAELEAERARAKKAEEKAAKERQEQDDKLKAEREAREKAERELKEKADQEAKEKAEAEAKAKQEEKERKAAERKAKNASDAQKLQTYLMGISTVELPSAKTEDGQQAVEEVLRGLVVFQNLIKAKIEAL